VIGLPPSVKIYVASSPCDMRWSFDRLASMVTETLKLDVYSGYLFLFTARRKDRVKILWWERGGFSLWYRRLEEGAFHFPERAGVCYEIEATELAILLEGIDLRGARRRSRWEPVRVGVPRA
jgi:transposase